MQVKTTRRYHFTPITLAKFFKYEHRGVGTIVEYRNSQSAMREWIGTCTGKYTLTTANSQRCTRYSAMPLLDIIPGVAAGLWDQYHFHSNTKTFGFFIFILSWVQWSFPEAHDVTADWLQKQIWEPIYLPLTQTLKDFQKCKSNNTLLTILFCFGKYNYFFIKNVMITYSGLL